MKHPRWSRKAKRMAIVLILLVGLVAIGLLGAKLFLPSHPRFGAIYEANAFDLNEARSDPVGLFLREHLPRRVVQSPYFPTRYKDQPRYLDLKGTRLEWSIAGDRTGWLYFWEPDVRPRVRHWEFASCSETNLLNVTDLPTEFHGSASSRRGEAFGQGSTTNAIKVSVGQILYARRTDEADRIYILKLKEQQKNKLVVNYCVTPSRQP